MDIWFNACILSLSLISFKVIWGIMWRSQEKGIFCYEYLRNIIAYFTMLTLFLLVVWKCHTMCFDPIDPIHNFTQIHPASFVQTKFYVNLKQTGVILEEGTIIEKRLLPNWLAGNSVMHFLYWVDVRWSSSLWVVLPLAWWSWVLKESMFNKPWGAS